MLLFANKARAAITNVGGVTAAAGQVATVAAGAGALFVGVGGVASSATNPIRCVMTAVDANGNDTGGYEIVDVVRNGDDLTLQTRGINSVAAAWPQGTIIECRPVASMFDEFPRLSRTDSGTSGTETSQIQVLNVEPGAASTKISLASGGKINIDAALLGDISGGGHVVGNIGWVSLAADVARLVQMLIAQEAKLDLISGIVTNAIAQESQLNDNLAQITNLFFAYNHLVNNHAPISLVAGSTLAVDANDALITYLVGQYIAAIQGNVGGITNLIGLFFSDQSAVPNITNKKVIWNLDPAAVIDTVGPIIQKGESVAVGGALVLAADNAAIASTSLQNVAGLVVPLAANQKYVIEWDIDLTIATTTETFGVGITLPAGATGNYDVISTNGAPATGAGTVKMAGNTIGTAIASGQFGNAGSATARVSARVKATVTVGGTAGSATLQLNGSTTGNIVVKANSSVVWTRV